MSTTKSMPKRSERSFVPRIIKTKKDYRAAMARIDELFTSKPGTADGDELELLLVLVERYEESEFPIGLPDPVSAIQFRLSQSEMTPDDLVPYLGSRKIVNDVLEKKRPLDLAMIRSLTKSLGIPAEVLLR